MSYECKHCNSEYSTEMLADQCCVLKGEIKDLLKQDQYVAKKYLSKITSSKRRGIDFDLTFSQYKAVMNKRKCYFTGIELTHGKVQDDQFTLDRIDSSVGYTKDNTVPCCHMFNQFKNLLEKSNIPMEHWGLILKGMEKLK